MPGELGTQQRHLAPLIARHHHGSRPGPAPRPDVSSLMRRESSGRSRTISAYGTRITTGWAMPRPW
jgi:hypothetical protein